MLDRITVHGARQHNLKNIDVEIPRNSLTVITGLSGSGKSSLLNETLARAITRRLTGLGAKPGPHGSLRGVHQIDKLVEIAGRHLCQRKSGALRRSVRNRRAHLMAVEVIWGG